MDLSVVVPCFDEEARLPAAVAALVGYLDQRGDSELLLVDDGSRDRTRALIREAAASRPWVCGIELTSNRGKGRATAAGVAASMGRLVLVTDVDLSAPIAELPKLERALAEGACVAFGSRAAHGAREVDQPLHRRAMGKAFNLVVQALVLPGIWDSQCGFKLFQGELARSIFAQLRTDGYAFDVEVLLRARRARCPLVEVPVRWINSDTTRVRAVRDSALMLRDLARIRLGR